MNLKSSDIDAIFDGATVTIGAAQNVANAVAAGINGIQNVMDGSRRNVPNPMGYQPQMGYQTPVTYGYGYSDNSYVGYGNGYPQTSQYSGQYSQMVPNGGYFGFTDPTYGMLTGNQSFAGNNGIPVNGPKGGAWGY